MQIFTSCEFQVHRDSVVSTTRALLGKLDFSPSCEETQKSEKRVEDEKEG